MRRDVRPLAGASRELVGVRVPVHLLWELDRLADAAQLGRSEAIRRAIAAWVRDQVDDDEGAA